MTDSYQGTHLALSLHISSTSVTIGFTVQFDKVRDALARRKLDHRSSFIFSFTHSIINGVFLLTSTGRPDRWSSFTLPYLGIQWMPFTVKGAAHGRLLRCILDHRSSLTRYFTKTCTQNWIIALIVTGSVTSISISVTFNAASLKRDCSITRNSNNF